MLYLLWSVMLLAAAFGVVEAIVFLAAAFFSKTEFDWEDTE